MFFYPSYISHLHSFGCPLGSQFGSWQQKYDPDRCAQNSYKNRLCFLTHQTFSIFIPLAVLGRPNLDPCGKSVILAGARKMRIKVVYVFCPPDIFHFHSSDCCLAPQLGSLRQKCDPGRCDQHLHKSRLCFFTQQTFSIFIPLAVTWGPNLDPCGKSVILAGAR